MKKRILSLVMCLCLTATFFPAGAFAVSGHETKGADDEASVTPKDGTTTYYATIEGAWEAATTTNGVTEATVTLLKNAEITETGNLSASLSVTEGKTITFTGADGATLTSNAGVVFNVNGGTLNITGGAVTGTHSTSGCVISVNSAGTANISGGTLTASGDSATTVSVYSNRDAENSSATISGTAVIKATGNRGCGVSCSANNNDDTAIVNIQGGTIESTGGELSTGVSATSKGKINITGGSIKAKFFGVGLSSDGIADIRGGTIQIDCPGGSSRPEGVSVQSGSNVTISGGTITVNNEAENNMGIGVTIRNSNLNKIPHGTISGGTISGPIGVEVEDGGVLTITDGNITGTEEGGLIVAEYDKPGKATLSGGTFTGTGTRTSAIKFESGGITSTGSLKDLLKTENGKTYGYFKNDVQIGSSKLKSEALNSTITVKESGKKDAGLTITPTVNGKVVTLTVAITPENLLSSVTVVGNMQDESLTLTEGSSGTWSYTLPDDALGGNFYDFTATFAGNNDYIADQATCSVTGSGEIINNDNPYIPGPDDIPAPTFSPAGGTYSSAQTVTMTAVEGAVIWYTLDGSNPYENEDGLLYEGPITISTTTTIKAGALILEEEGEEPVALSDVATATYTITGGGSSGGGSRPSGGSSSGGTTTSKPTTNPDGSTTTKTENKTTGTVTETTKAPDGSQTVVETQKNGTVTTTATDKDGNKTETVAQADGSSVTKVEQKDGTTANVTTAPSGKTQAEVKVPAAVAQAAQQSGETLALPIPAVRARTVRADAPEVTVSTGSSTPVKVEIPTADPTPGTVAVLVHDNGTEEVIKTSLPTDGGVAVALADGATVKIVDNSKTFADVPADNWAADAVAFSSARELFDGTGENTFTPDAPMTRAMLVTVLARFDGTDTSGGETWYDKGLTWAVENQISDGSSPEASITREQLAVMLWRYAGSPESSQSLDGFQDASQISDYAQTALAWAHEQGIVNGFENGTLAPQGQATRAQVAQMLANFIQR